MKKVRINNQLPPLIFVSNKLWCSFLTLFHSLSKFLL